MKALNLTHVVQTKMTYPDGNCFAACISMITGIPLEEIPNFASYAEAKGNWWKDISDWLAPRGWGGVMITEDAMQENKADFYMARIAGIPFILTGKSPGGDWNHCVVQWEEDNELKQLDPHPRNRGVLEPIADVILLMPLKAFTKEHGPAPSPVAALTKGGDDKMPVPISIPGIDPNTGMTGASSTLAPTASKVEGK